MDPDRTGQVSAGPSNGPSKRSAGRILVHWILLALTLVIGLTTRSHPNLYPGVIATYGGDTLWATFVVLLLALLWRRGSVARIALLAGGFSFFIEISQLYHAGWIDPLRASRVGGLILGFEFLASDLVCYGVGIALGSLLLQGLRGLD